MSASSNALVFALPALLAGVLMGAPQARGQDAAFDAAEAQTALKAALALNQELQERLTTEKAANDAMAVKVGILSAEASTVRDELAELRRRAEAVGPAGDTRGLEQRVLDALNDLRLTREARRASEDRLLRLTEATQAYLHAGVDAEPALRITLEQALAVALEVDGKAEDASASSPVRIESSRVVSVKPDQRLLVVNAGRLAGMKTGTPLRIYRNDRPLASAVVVEVRPSLSGSLITKLEGDDFPQVGDTLRLISEPINQPQFPHLRTRIYHGSQSHRPSAAHLAPQGPRSRPRNSRSVRLARARSAQLCAEKGRHPHRQDAQERGGQCGAQQRTGTKHAWS